MTFQIGNHTIRVEDGVLQIFFAGRMDVDEVKLLQTRIFEAGDRFGLLTCLVDLDKLVDFDAGVRGLLARPARPYPFDAVAYFGGTFAVRTLVTTVNRAGRFIAPKAFAFDGRTFATEAEARRFLETARQKRTVAR